ncbi:MAG: polysaccharide biosynthesis tyrosine autokinase [Actinomycetota bacterium]
MEADGSGSDIELREYLRVLRHRAWILVLLAVIAVASSVALSRSQTPMYAATAELRLQPRGSEQLFDSQVGPRFDATRAIQTEIRVIESRPVRERVRRDLPDAPAVSASAVSQTDIVLLRVESADPGLAAAAANAYAQGYIDHRREAEVADLASAITELEKSIAELDTQIAGAPESSRLALGNARNALLETRQDLILSSRVKTGGAQIVQDAVVPSGPFSPQPIRTAAVALVLGLLLGVGLVFLLDYLDDTIKTKDDLERASGLPVIGLIPEVAGTRRDQPTVQSLDDPSSSAAEAYRTMRTSVQFMGFDKPVKVIQVTSPSSAEGKTTTIANLGVALARAGRQVTVMCCDLRRPRLHKFFEMDNDVGFTSVLLRETTLASALQPVDELPRLTVLASGPVPPNPSELLASKSATEMISPLTVEERLVLVDSPPVLPVTDALVISRWADVTLLVCSAGVTRRGEVQRAVELLQRVGAPVVGAVLNGVKKKAGYGYDYRYHYRPHELSSNGVGEHQTSRRERRRERRAG